MIVLDQYRDPEDFEVAAIQIFALCVQVPLIYLELIAERIDRLDLLGLNKIVKHFIEARDSVDRLLMILSCPTHTMLQHISVGGVEPLQHNPDDLG